MGTALLFFSNTFFFQLISFEKNKCAVVRWQKTFAKSMTEKNGGTARQVCNCLCALAGGLLNQSQKRSIYFFTLLDGNY
ncbi:hypothetical protein JJC04_03210 [Flavobacterium covae]|nr:hypothetical protein [Flavobacterium covae]QYS91731.1 hypothetical protein JJC04_03170 [Flavobacterium covae]QYS91739.1 hypothetical protein JJC04_03210 [Flavobacterium covae]